MQSVGILRDQRYGSLVKGICCKLLYVCCSEEKKNGVTAVDSPTLYSLNTMSYFEICFPFLAKQCQSELMND